MLTRADALASTSLIERSVTALLTVARESPDIGEDHHDGPPVPAARLAAHGC